MSFPGFSFPIHSTTSVPAAPPENVSEESAGTRAQNGCSLAEALTRQIFGEFDSVNEQDPSSGRIVQRRIRLIHPEAAADLERSSGNITIKVLKRSAGEENGEHAAKRQRPEERRGRPETTSGTRHFVIGSSSMNLSLNDRSPQEALHAAIDTFKNYLIAEKFPEAFEELERISAFIDRLSGSEQIAFASVLRVALFAGMNSGVWDAKQGDRKIFLFASQAYPEPARAARFFQALSVRSGTEALRKIEVRHLIGQAFAELFVMRANLASEAAIAEKTHALVRLVAVATELGEEWIQELPCIDEGLFANDQDLGNRLETLFTLAGEVGIPLANAVFSYTPGVFSTDVPFRASRLSRSGGVMAFVLSEPKGREWLLDLTQRVQAGMAGSQALLETVKSAINDHNVLDYSSFLTGQGKTLHKVEALHLLGADFFNLRAKSKKDNEPLLIHLLFHGQFSIAGFRRTLELGINPHCLQNMDLTEKAEAKWLNMQASGVQPHKLVRLSKRLGLLRNHIEFGYLVARVRHDAYFRKRVVAFLCAQKRIGILYYVPDVTRHILALTLRMEDEELLANK